MKYVVNREDYLNAVEDYLREWSNYVVITDGVHTETYTSAEIRITVPFADDTLTMGKAYSKELNLKIFEPERTLIYNLSNISVYSKLKVGESYTTVQMGVFFPSEVTTNDDYQTLEIKAYDFMGKLNVPYEPNYNNITKNSMDYKVYYVAGGKLMSGTVGDYHSSPTTLTGGTLSFTNNSGITVWIYTKSGNTWTGRTLSDDSINKIENGGTLSVTCDEYTFSVYGDYVGGLSCNGVEVKPQTSIGILKDIQSQYGFSLAGSKGKYNIDTIYEGTVAETLGWLAGMEGKNAVFNDDGYLVYHWYTTPSNFAGRWLDYPIAWQDANFTWQSMNKVATIDRNEQKESGVKINEGTFTIASITSGTEENPITVGTGKGISFENPYMTQDLLTTIGNRELGKSTAIGEVKSFGNPLFEVGDIVAVIDKDENPHTFFISKIEWDFTGGCSAIYSAIGNPDAEIEFDNISPTDKKISKVKTVLQTVVTRFANLINSMVGYFTLTEENGVPTGWTIKDDLNNPQNMIKCSLGGIGISSNGGQTYQTAMTGEGIVADSITTGTMLADRIKGGTLELGGLNNELGNFKIIDTDGTTTRIELTNNRFIFTPREKQAELIRWTGDDYNNNDYYGTLYVNGINVFRNWNTSVTPTTYDFASHYTESAWWTEKDSGQYQVYCAPDFQRFVYNNTTKIYMSTSSGNVTAVSFTNTSEESTKEDIKPLGSTLDTVKNADICTYKLKDEAKKKGAREHIGMVIGDKYNTPSELITETATEVDGKTETVKGIDLYAMNSVLWKAVQELSTQVDELTKEVELLRGGKSGTDK